MDKLNQPMTEILKTYIRWLQKVLSYFRATIKCRFSEPKYFDKHITKQQDIGY